MELSTSSIILLALLSGTHQHPDIALNSSIPTGSYVFIDQGLAIYCTSTGSELLLWESDQYIGPHLQVSLTYKEVINGEVISGSVSIIDVQNNGSGEQRQISSKLSLVVLPNFEVFTIKCRNGDHGFEANVTYHLSDKSAIEIKVPNNESTTCPRNDLSVRCDARNTTSLMIQLSGDLISDNVTVQCNKNDSENRLIHTTIDNMFIIYMNNIGDGTSCTVLFGTELLIRSETSLFNVSCFNTEIGVQANKTFRIPGNLYCESTTVSTYSLITTNTGSGATESNYGAISGIALAAAVLPIILIASILAILLYIKKRKPVHGSVTHGSDSENHGSITECSMK